MQRNNQSPNLARAIEAVEPQVILKADIPRDLVGPIIGKSGATVRRIESDTDACVNVEVAKNQGERTYVVAKGSIQQVDNVFKEVQAEVAKFDTTIAEQLQRTLELVPPKAASQAKHHYEGNMMSSWERRNAFEWNPRDLTVWVRLEAMKCTFRSLNGRNRWILESIIVESGANIKIEGHRDRTDVGYITIQGLIENVVQAIRKLKEILQACDPRHDPSTDLRSVNLMDLRVVKAKAQIKIVESAGGLVVGKNGENIKRISRETHVEYISIEKDEATGKSDRVCIIGHVTPVVEAIQQVQYSLRDYSSEAVRAVRRGLQSEPMDYSQFTCLDNPAYESQAASRAASTLDMAPSTPSTHSSSLVPQSKPLCGGPMCVILKDGPFSAEVCGSEICVNGNGLQLHCIKEAGSSSRLVVEIDQHQPSDRPNLPPGFSNLRDAPRGGGDGTMQRLPAYQNPGTGFPPKSPFY